ncbi:MAG: response regulator [Pseudomonadota bacterium]
MNFLHALFAHYRAYYADGRRTTKHAAWVGLFAFPLCYLVYTTLIPQAYESLGLRLSAAVLCALLVAQASWPSKLKPYCLAYSYWLTLYCLPCLHVFMLLKNQGSPVSVAHSFLAIFLLFFLSDWRNSLALLLLGSALGTALYLTTTESPSFPIACAEQLPIFLLAILAASVFRRSEERIVYEQELSAKAALVGSLVHEMRVPLGQLKSTLDNIEDALPAPSEHTHERHHAHDGHDGHEIKLNILTLNTLFQNLARGQSAIKRGLQAISMIFDEVNDKGIDQANFSYCMAGKITQKAVDEFAHENEAEAHRIRVCIEHDFTFKGSESLSLFVLFNLIKNALHFCQRDTQASLTINVNQPTITLRDSGPGIAKDSLTALFNAPKSTDKLDGTGLNLACCQRIMASFGGNISGHSVLGEYTEFTLHFPAITESEIAEYQKNTLHKASMALKGKHILLVEDGEIEARLMLQTLNNIGCRADRANNGASALDQLAQGQVKYDLILTDLNMPTLNGYATASKIRTGAVPGYEQVPIVAYSTESESIASAKIRKAGMNAFVHKPYDTLALLETVQRCLNEAEDTVATAENVAERFPLLAGKTILIAEDSVINRLVLKATLQKFSMQALEAEHGQAVLELCQHWQNTESGSLPDAILMDIHMPGLNGLEVTNLIRERKSSYQHIPIIALSSDESAQSRQNAYAAGADDFIAKPVDSNELCAKLNQQFAQRCQQAAPADQINPASQAEQDAARAKELMNLLDSKRLDEIISIDMLDSLLPYYIEQSEVLLKRLDNSVAAENFAEMHEALHHFLGISGTMGALALHRLIQRIYPPVEAGAWPTEASWLDQIKALSEKTVCALQENYIKKSPAR